MKSERLVKDDLRDHDCDCNKLGGAYKNRTTDQKDLVELCRWVYFESDSEAHLWRPALSGTAFEAGSNYAHSSI